MKNSVSLKSVLLCTLIGASFMSENGYASSLVEPFPVAVRESTQDYVSQRPEVSKRLFHSKAVEAKIQEVKKLLTNPYLRWMFENCFPNTLDTTVHYRTQDGDDDTFVYTGDIHAMWLRDSGAQVWYM